LALFLRQQVIYITLVVVICAILWGSGQRVNVATILVYTICTANLVAPGVTWLRFLYEEKKFPYNLLIFLPILLVMTIPIYLITSVVVWLVAPPAPVTLLALILSGWKFSFVATFLFSTDISDQHHEGSAGAAQRRVAENGRARERAVGDSGTGI
jgi:hypothetical protein